MTPDLEAELKALSAKADLGHENHRKLLRKKLEALHRSGHLRVVREDQVVVPREPTVAMMKAGELGWCHHDHGNLQGRAAQCYRAMLTAAGVRDG